MFKVGTRVQVVNEEEARRTHAAVSRGQKGTVVGEGTSADSVYVRIDYPMPTVNSLWRAGPWYIPVGGLRRIHCKKVKVD